MESTPDDGVCHEPISAAVAERMRGQALVRSATFWVGITSVFATFVTVDLLPAPTHHLSKAGSLQTKPNAVTSKKKVTQASPKRITKTNVARVTSPSSQTPASNTAANTSTTAPTSQAVTPVGAPAHPVPVGHPVPQRTAAPTPTQAPAQTPTP